MSDHAIGARHIHQIARLDYTAKHQTETADDVRDRIFHTERHRKTANAERGENRGRINAEHRLQHSAHSQRPHHRAQNIDENRSVRHLRTVQHFAHDSGKRLVDNGRKQCNDNEQNDFPELVFSQSTTIPIGSIVF